MVKPALATDWKLILRRAWSVRLIAGAILLSGGEVALQAMIALAITPPIPAGLFALLAAVVSMAAMIARVVAQKGL